MKLASLCLPGLALLSLTPVLASCMSQSPYPITYSFATQKKMQAAEHWKVYAKDIAQALSGKIKTDRPIYIERSGKEPVHPLLANFLEEQLLNNGFRIVPNDGEDAFTLTTNTRVIVHSDKQMNTTVGMVPAMIGGMIVAVAGSSEVEDTEKTKAAIDEVVITTKIWERGEVKLSFNNAFYIDSSEAWQYDLAPHMANAGGGTPQKKMAITGD